MKIPRKDQHYITPVRTPTTSNREPTVWHCKQCNAIVQIVWEEDIGCCNEKEMVPVCPNDPILKQPKKINANVTADVLEQK